ncbi:MAG: zinc ribbon domain-containing protein [Lachnospiraceae bacterium]|nr:zinc ribbon domain-containing protein [Lachnospiraceae bacterium]
MKSIKPGRGPSMMGGVTGIFMIGFGVIWTLGAAQMSPLFALFGVLWTGIAIAQTVYNFKNATSKNRYSSFDITEGDEEPDPLNVRFGEWTEEQDTYKADAPTGDSKFCPYCGTKVEADYTFCNECGKKLP